VSLEWLFLEKRKWSISTDGDFMTLTAQMRNTGAGLTKAKAVFRVFDSHGVLITTLTTPEEYIHPGPYFFGLWWGEVLRPSAELNVAELDAPASYTVELHIEYLNYLGTWVAGRTRWLWFDWGRTTIVRTFQLKP
jgi:hypothetical protein